MGILQEAMTPQRLARAMNDVSQVCGLGSVIRIFKPATKDTFGTLLTEEYFELSSFPIRYAPYPRKVSQDISWSEDTDILCYAAKKDLDGLDITIQQARTYKYLQHNNKKYTLRYVEPYSQFGDNYLYVIFGGKI